MTSRWAKGTSGNPSGRPRSERARADVRKAITKGIPAIVEKLQALALAGDVRAAETLLARGLPPLKAVAPEVSLPGYTTNMSNTQAANAVFEAVATGQMPPDLGAQLITSLAAAARVAEVDEFRARLEDLESRLTGGMA